jgi:cytochrome c oxidase subunit 2
MSTSFPLFPQSASTISPEVDLLYLFIAAVSAFFVVLIATMVVVFTVKYRRRHPDEVGDDIHGSLALELTWTFIPFVLALIMFVWGANLYFTLARPPADSMEIFAVGKQWMWKVEHPEGVREINELHVPIHRNIRVTLGSEDVIHDFFIPAFRVKMDAVPGKLTTLWFNATTPGTYHLFCAEYCGTKHSGMIGQVIAMTPEDYEAWLGGGAPTENPAALGEKLFTQNGCVSCHRPDGTGVGPSLVGVPGSTVTLSTGQTVTADDNYLRESMMIPSAKIVKGYPQPSPMPPFQGLLSEEDVMRLIAYLKSLKPGAAGAGAPGSSAPAGPVSQ